MVSPIITEIRTVLGLVAQLPGWLLYFGAPLLLVVAGVILAAVHADRAFPPVALFLGGVGLFLVASIAEELADLAVWAAMYLAAAALVRLIFLILAETPKGWLLLDYKFSSRSDDALRSGYAPQIVLYKKAVAKAMRVSEDTVRARILNIALCREIGMD